MRRAWLAATLSILSGCGGLRHIPAIASDPEWRPIENAPRQAAASRPLPAEIPVRQLDIRGSFVAVFDIQDKSGRLSARDIDALTDYLAGRLAEDGLFHVVPREEIKRRLVSQKAESYKACYDEACQIEIGREVAGQKSLSVSVAAVGQMCLVTASLFDLKKAATDVTASSRGSCGAEQLVEQLELVVEKFRKVAR